jgi:WD40 repeat protein
MSPLMGRVWQRPLEVRIAFLLTCSSLDSDLYLADAHVRIWSTESIYSSADPEYTKPKQLAALSTHSGTIHSVRFSGSNKYLASGADDKIVCIYGLDPNPPTHAHSFGMIHEITGCSLVDSK